MNNFSVGGRNARFKRKNDLRDKNDFSFLFICILLPELDIYIHIEVLFIHDIICRKRYGIRSCKHPFFRIISYRCYRFSMTEGRYLHEVVPFTTEVIRSRDNDHF